MKRQILAAALLAAVGTANATLAWVPTSTLARTETFNNIAGLPTMAAGTPVTLGDLTNVGGGTITFTYLGSEALFFDRFHLILNGTTINQSDATGSSLSYSPLPNGFVDFKFEGDAGRFAVNGGTKDAGTSIGLIGTDMTVTSGAAAGSYAFVLGYNDSAGAGTTGDWDDFVVGVNFAPIPEPETYALMLAGLGVMGFVARRRRAN
jgi:hypothetical protein